MHWVKFIYTITYRQIIFRSTWPLKKYYFHICCTLFLFLCILYRWCNILSISCTSSIFCLVLRYCFHCLIELEYLITRSLKRKTDILKCSEQNQVKITITKQLQRTWRTEVVRKMQESTEYSSIILYHIIEIWQPCTLLYE